MRWKWIFIKIVYYFHFRLESIWDFECFIYLFIISAQLVMDDKVIANHPLTTKEILECIRDIKVLGKKELRYVIRFDRKQLRRNIVSIYYFILEM